MQWHQKRERRKMLIANLDSLNSLANVDDPEIKVRKLSARRLTKTLPSYFPFEIFFSFFFFQTFIKYSTALQY